MRSHNSSGKYEDASAASSTADSLFGALDFDGSLLPVY